MASNIESVILDRPVSLNHSATRRDGGVGRCADVLVQWQVEFIQRVNHGHSVGHSPRIRHVVVGGGEIDRFDGIVRRLYVAIDNAVACHVHVCGPIIGNIAGRFVHLVTVIRAEYSLSLFRVRRRRKSGHCGEQKSCAFGPRVKNV